MATTAEILAMGVLWEEGVGWYALRRGCRARGRSIAGVITRSSSSPKAFLAGVRIESEDGDCTLGLPAEAAPPGRRTR
jgi:hypothetical protein